MIYLILLLFLTGACLCASGYASLYRDSIEHTGTFAAKALTSLVAVFGGLALGALILSDSLDVVVEGMCSTDITSQIPSPSGENVATIFTRDCGAVTTSKEIVPIVMLRDRLHPVMLNEGERIIFRSNWLGRRVDDIVYVGEMKAIRWISDSHLEIRPVTSEPGDTAWQNVKVSYKRPKQKVKIK